MTSFNAYRKRVKHTKNSSHKPNPFILALSGFTVLEQIAEIFKQKIRKTDLVSRWGGEEFTIPLPNTDKEKALRIAEKLRDIIEKSYFNAGVSTVSITIYLI